MKTKTNYGNLNAAFADLRKQGFLARQNFLCCSTCGLYDLGYRADELQAKDEYVAGIVFYHSQDNDDKVDGRKFYLTFLSAAVGMSTKKVGEAVVKILNRNGVKTEWNGKADRRIAVLPQGASK
jgi:Fe-S oxidoreductase